MVGRANQRQGLDEIANELGQISSQLKQELRRGKRNWGLFPNTAWARNHHLVSEEGGKRAAVASAYAQVYELSVETQGELDEEQTEKRQRAKEAVDAAARLITGLRDEVQL